MSKFLYFYFRYLNDRMISYDPSFEVKQLMAGQPGLQWPVGTVLTVAKTNSVNNDGHYTCAPSTLTTDSVIVHIIDEGKIPPVYAVYGDSSRAFQPPISAKFWVVGYLLVSTVWWTWITQKTLSLEIINSSFEKSMKINDARLSFSKLFLD